MRCLSSTNDCLCNLLDFCSVLGMAVAIRHVLRMLDTYLAQVTLEQRAASDLLGRRRAQAVKAAFQHAWRGYREMAWGADEVGPKTGRMVHSWGGGAPLHSPNSANVSGFFVILFIVLLFYCLFVCLFVLLLHSTR